MRSSCPIVLVSALSFPRRMSCYDDLSAFGSSMALTKICSHSGFISDVEAVTDVISQLPLLSLSESFAPP